MNLHRFGVRVTWKIFSHLLIIVRPIFQMCVSLQQQGKSDHCFWSSWLTTSCWVQSTLSSHQRSWGGKVLTVDRYTWCMTMLLVGPMWTSFANPRTKPMVKTTEDSWLSRVPHNTSPMSLTFSIFRMFWKLPAQRLHEGWYWLGMKYLGTHTLPRRYVFLHWHNTHTQPFVEIHMRPKHAKDGPDITNNPYAVICIWFDN